VIGIGGRDDEPNCGAERRPTTRRSAGPALRLCGFFPCLEGRTARPANGPCATWAGADTRFSVCVSCNLDLESLRERRLQEAAVCASPVGGGLALPSQGRADNRPGQGKP